MKEEWKKVEGSYEQALKELEKNVHILVDVKEDEVKAKVESIAKIYEQKISKMKEKLIKCEDKLKAKKERQYGEFPDKFNLKDLEKLEIPNGNLCLSPVFSKEKKPARESGSKSGSRRRRIIEELLSCRENK